MTGEPEDPVRAAIEAELYLLRPEVRAEPGLVLGLLDPGFVEFGASGRRWDRASVAGALGGEAEFADPVTATEMAGVLIAPGVVHLTYVSSRTSGRRARRSSLWRHDGQGWRMYFHQGTLIPETGD
jgi:hypothetical protein